MEHLAFLPTPITFLPYFSQKYKASLFCKRDDLFYEAGGGNKARMLQYILFGVNPHSCDVVVTAGNPCSNFNRACALSCAKLGVPLHIVEYSDNEKDFELSDNRFICQLAGTRFTRSKKTDVAFTIKKVVEGYGCKRVKLIYGGGRSLEGIYAYYEAVRELSAQIKDLDYVFVPCGTGTTCTGISAGLHEFFPNAKLYAISVSRSYDLEIPVLQEDLEMLNEYFRKNFAFSNLRFDDSYLCGGYNCSNEELAAIIKDCISHEGMLLDSCYSGKAFYGMDEIIGKNPKVFEGKNILFWNTGGLFNLLSDKIYD